MNHNNPSLLDCQDQIDDVDIVLIEQCLAGNRQAWDNFFRLASPYIGRIIRTTLLANGDQRNHNEEFVDMIFIQVVEELYRHRRLASLNSPAGLKPYLRQVVRSKINNWYRTNLSRKNLAGTVIEENMASLQTTKSLRLNNPHTKHENLLCHHLPAGDRMDKLLEQCAEQWRTILSPRDQWILRLKAVYYVPLSENEIENLARFSNQPLARIRDIIAEIISRLASRDEKSSRNREQAVTLMAIRNRLLQKLRHEKEKGILDPKEVMRQEHKLATITARQKEMTRQGNLPLTPSTREILHLMAPGTTDWEAAERRFNTHLSRLRQRCKTIPKNVREL